MEYSSEDQSPAEESGDSEADSLLMPVQRGEDMDEFYENDDDSESCTASARYCDEIEDRMSEDYAIDGGGEDRKVMAWSAWLAAVAKEVVAEQQVAVDDAEKSRLFWETCLASGYP